MQRNILQENSPLFYLLSLILKHYDSNQVINFIENKNYYYLPGIQKDIADIILNSEDLMSDVYWYLEIRDKIDINNFPCIHLAYACSDRLGNIIEENMDIFSIITNKASKEGIVIGHCPWCGIKLNTSAL